jgi:hypothetical protein
MKKLLFTICASALLWSGCKEHDTLIDFSASTSVDTTYLVTAPAAAPHQVLVEEFSGQSCPNCPNAHTDLDNISAANPGLVNVVTLYVSGSPQTDPPSGAKYDFRDSIALIISGSAIYGGVGSWPSAGIDRTLFGGALLQIGQSSFNGPINTQLAIKDDSVNVSIASAYDSSTEIATITAGVTYTQAVSTPQNLSIMLVEDSMYDLQEDNGAIVSNYLFLDVFRGMATAVIGDPLQVTSGNNAKEAGRFFQRVYSYTLPVKSPAIVPAHCRLIAFVSYANGSDLHVMQSAQCKLIQ